MIYPEKIIMVLAGGTGTAWHICKTIKKYYSNVHLIVCDINPKHLVHSSIFADEFIKVLPISSQHYEEYMYNIFMSRHVDILIPLIDYDIAIFGSDNENLIENNICSVSPKKTVFTTLSNKKNMNVFMNQIGVVTPDIYNDKTLELSQEYIIKDTVGYGSRSIEKIKGRDISKLEDGKIIQDICFSPEVTVDVLNNGGVIFGLCRERLEVKAGVCTKAKVYFDNEIIDIIKKVSENIALPDIFCVQFMKNKNNDWTLIDFNLRPGAGTAMSAAVGFQSVRAALSIWLKENKEIINYLKYPVSEQYVVRSYREIVTSE